MTGVLGMMVGIQTGLGGTVGTPNLAPNATVPGGPALATVSLTNAGVYSSSNDLSGNYCTPTSLASLLEARLTFNSGTGTPTGSSLGVWLNLGTTRSWTLNSGSGLIRDAVCTLEIRESATGIVRDTSTVTFTADGT